MNQNRALVIGIGADLPMTVTDAKGIAAILTDPLRCNFESANVRLLAEADATRVIGFSQPWMTWQLLQGTPQRSYISLDTVTK